MRAVWLIVGLTCVALGILGAILPLLPATVFFLIAAFAFARSSERLHTWLMTHRLFGPPIVRWQERGAIGRREKWLATGSIVVAFGLSAILGLRPMLLGIQALVLSAVSIFIWTRPDG
jgi:uncharacterized membrane protein YbaN (DUF454 family)